MRVVYFGTPAFAVPTLQALLDAGHDVCAVVAQPDRPAGRGHALQSPPTVELARRHGIPVLQPTKVKSGPFPEQVESLAADVGVVVAYGRILTPRLLAAPRRGCINVHASLLPRWRGAAPIQWAVIAGDRVTGVTTMQMAEGLDTGDVLLRAELPLDEEMTAGELHDRLAPVGAALLVRTLTELDRIVPVPQDEAEATYAPMLQKEDGRVDWNLPARALACRVRGLNPWPGAFTRLRGEVLKVHRARAVAGEGAPGTLLPGARVACGEGALELVEVQLPGRKRVSGADLVNGLRLEPGTWLGG